MTIRHLLLDLEAGRWANDPDGALEFLASQYFEHPPALAEDEISWLNEEISRLERECDDAWKEVRRLKEKIRRAGVELR